MTLILSCAISVATCLLLIDIVKDYPNARRSSDGKRVAKVIPRAMKKMFSAAQSPWLP